MAGSIPRAVTCPAFYPPGGSSPRGLPTWRRAPSPPSAALPSGVSSRAILAATLALYTVVLLGLPLLYSSSSRWHSAGGSLAAAGASDLPGVLQPQLARALSSRRLALEAGQGAAAELWPDAAGFGTAAAQQPRVEYRDAGNVVSLVDALNISQWPNELPLYLASESRQGVAPGDCCVAAAAAGVAARCDWAGAQQHLHCVSPPLSQRASLPWWRPAAGPVPIAVVPLTQQASRASGGGGSSEEQQLAGGGGVAPPFPALCPQGDIRLFIGVTSRCCTAEVRAGRSTGQRRAWDSGALTRRCWWLVTIAPTHLHMLYVPRRPRPSGPPSAARGCGMHGSTTPT